MEVDVFSLVGEIFAFFAITGGAYYGSQRRGPRDFPLFLWGYRTAGVSGSVTPYDVGEVNSK